ncbi:MAG: 4-hydroxy-3-methylbut-2-enyl diphosphate reductase [Paludibacteraceae bacterium]
MVTIEIDNTSGFCFGVVNAIKKAEEELQTEQRLCCLGDIVHNEQEMRRLSDKGLVAIDHAQLQQLHGCKVLFRAHGEPPETYNIARRNDIQIVDASCPVVLALQKKIRTAYTEFPEAQIVIYGKRGHAEVNGLVGQTNGHAIVVEHADEIDTLDFGRDIILFSQTTQSVAKFNNLVETIRRRMRNGAQFKFFDTICRQVANRIPNIRNFASRFDMVLFVSGAKSSNGKVLFSECIAVNPRSYFISTADDIDPDTLHHVASIGICGATSTPKWLMEEIAEKLNKLLNN